MTSSRSTVADREPVLAAEGLHRFYRRGDSEVAALLDVTVILWPGEMVAVVGPSGSGKSTLLGLLAGLDEPDGGHVRLCGQRLSHQPDAQQSRLRGTHIGVLTQGSGLLDHLSLAGNVRLAGSFRGRRSPQNAGLLLERLGLGARAAARPATLSGGETARANLAVALAGGPDVLLADEPTAEVSRAEETQVIAMLRAEADSGQATLIVTHSPELAAAADRVIQLRDGRLR